MDNDFDFGSVAVNETAVMVVKHPKTGDPTPASITLAGPEHPKHKALTMAAMRAARKRAEKAGKLVLTDPEDDAQTALDKAVACTIAWDGVKRDGKALECSAANVRELYESAPWLRDQVLTFLAGEENFIEAAA